MSTAKTLQQLTAESPSGNPSLSTEFLAGPGYTYSLSEIRAAMSTSLPFKVFGAVGSGADYECTGTSDQTIINTGLTTVGGGLSFFKAGTYNIAGLVNPLSNSSIFGEGYGTLFQLGSGGSKTIKLQTLSHVTLRDFRVDGTNISSSNAFGMFIDKCNDVTVDHVWVLNCNGFGIFINASTSTEYGKIRVLNSYISGMGNADVLGGGPSDADGVLGELIISGNYVVQGVGSSPGTYANAIDLVAQKTTIIDNNTTRGSIILGGEKIPHLNVNVTNNIIQPSLNSGFGRIAVLTSSNAGESDDSKGITISGNQISAGHIYVQGQSATTSRTRKIVVANNNIGGLKTDPETELNWGIDLNYLSDVVVEGNIIDGSDRGIYINDVSGIDISNNRFINCNTPMVIGVSGVTNMTGHNNVGINPDIYYEQGDVSGAVTFDRVNGLTISATAVGNITTTIPDTYFKGEKLTLIITQDATGGRTISKPSNVKLVGGAFSPTATANAVDSWTLVWDGTDWQEVSRSINMS